MKRASYREAVAWIAENDEDASWSETSEIDGISTYISTLLVADLFGVEATRVATDIARYRRKYGIGKEILP